MKVYLLWYYEQYYPTGPGSLRGVFKEKSDAENSLRKLQDEVEKNQIKYGYPGSEFIRITEETLQ